MKTFIADNFAPSAALGMVADALQGRTARYFQDNLHTDIDLSHTDMLVSGMAFNEEAARTEVALIQRAGERGIPVALYADTWGCALREPYAGIRKYVRIVFVINEDEKEAAAQLFQNATIIVAGNPLWQKAARERYDRKAVRERMGIPLNATVALLACRKEEHINLPFLEVCADAFQGTGVICVVSIHPRAERRELYPARIDAYGFMRASASTGEMLDAADLVVNTASGAGVEAVYKRVPVLEYAADVVCDEVERLHYTRTWKLVKDGVALPFVTKGELRSSLNRILQNDGGLKEELLRTMERLYPLPSKSEDAVHIMAEHLSSL